MRIRSILIAAALTTTAVLGGAGMATADDAMPPSPSLDGNMQLNLDGAGQSMGNGPSGLGNGPSGSTMIDQD
ncbi:hypothetical protein [Streptomyces violascens]|uniref:Secreted protein n=1 Tax=Streptomyces violascens TaxID=67381 RepID=A0ABQ3QTA7_9ACTN|nr:hypothetical protein [Streptomyces violascens]GHI40510.1 hypothetical protein Sviol_49180 [Streptomyces violascens]